MMNAAPALFSAFKPIDSSSSDSSLEEPLSPLAIFRDGESGASSGTRHPLMQRANPIDSMDCSNDDGQQQHVDEEDLVWTDAHQRVISPFPEDDDHHPDMPHTDSWKDVAVEHVDFSHFFPSANTGVMECDDFSLSSAASDEDLVLADDLTNPESFWESGSNLTDSRSPSPAQVSIGSNSSNNSHASSSTCLFPPSPTSTTQVHELELSKPRLMPC